MTTNDRYDSKKGGTMTIQVEIQDRVLADERCQFRPARLEPQILQLESAANQLISAASFPSLLALCISTRRTGDMLHSAILLIVEQAKIEPLKSLIQRFVNALKDCRPVIDEVVQTTASSAEGRLAARYRHSIDLREQWAACAMSLNRQAMFRELMSVNWTRHQTIEPIVIRPVPDDVERDSFEYCAGVTAAAMNWLMHKLALVRAELEIEGGPWAACTREHKTIAEQVRECTLMVLNDLLKTIANFPERAGDAEASLQPHGRRLGNLLEDFELQIINPLRRIASQLVDTGDGELPSASDALDDEAEQCVKRLTHDVLRLLEKSAYALQRLECRRSGLDDLSVLLSQSSSGDRWFAHCLERSQMAQAARPQDAIENLASVVQVDAAHHGEHPEIEPYRPAEDEIFQTYENAVYCALQPLYVTSPKFRFFVRSLAGNVS